jgi:L-lactate dehydrogenase complex protein LldG
MLDQFQAAAEAVGATIKRFISLTEAVAYVQALAADSPVSASALPASIAAAFAGTAFCAPKDHVNARVCVSSARAGIAATGSLLLELSNPQERAATALSPIHAVFMKASDIVADLYALQDLIGQRLSSPGAACLSITTGPSRTADIERVLTIGVHGPKELHVLVLEGE